MNISLQMVITIVGAGIAAYVGVRVALAQVQTTQANQQEEIKKVCGRLDRLESPYFQARKSRD